MYKIHIVQDIAYPVNLSSIVYRGTIIYMKNVVIYSTPSCVYCKMAKAYFDEKGIKYSDKDVMVDVEARKEMMEKSGQLGVPVIDIGGKIIVGFDKGAIKDLLEL